MVHAPSARLRPVSGVRRCYRADKRNLERYAFPPSAIGIDCDRHHWLGCQGNHRFRCQHDAILSQVTGTSAPVSLSLPNRLPQQSYLPLPQSTDLELTTSSGLCVFRLDTPLFYPLRFLRLFLVILSISNTTTYPQLATTDAILSACSPLERGKWMHSVAHPPLGLPPDWPCPFSLSQQQHQSSTPSPTMNRMPR